MTLRRNTEMRFTCTSILWALALGGALAGSALAAPINIALTESYSASPDITDTGTWWLGENAPHVKFTNGVSNWAWGDVTGWMGGTVPLKNIDLTVDLGELHADIQGAEVDQFVSVSSGVPGSDSIAVSGSTDGTTFSPWGTMTVTGPPATETMFLWSWTGSSQTARYVRFRISWASGDPHVLLSEIRVNAATVPAELSLFSAN